MSTKNVINKTGTKEWADKNENIQFGCQNNCKYCYAKAMSPRHKKTDVDSWSTPILKEKIQVSYRKSGKSIMFPSTHDIHEDQIDIAITQLKRMLSAGNTVLIVTKPRIACVKAMCKELAQYKKLITFRFTIGSMNNDVLQFWEPSAPLIEERIESLQYAHAKGFTTSISCEPMLDANIESVITAVSPYVTDTIWLGKMNHSSRNLKINGYGDSETLQKAKDLEDDYSDNRVLELYDMYKDDPLIRWKDSIQKVLEECGVFEVNDV